MQRDEVALRVLVDAPQIVDEIPHAQRRGQMRAAARQRHGTDACRAALHRHAAAGVALHRGVCGAIAGRAQRIVGAARHAHGKAGARMHGRVAGVQCKALVLRGLPAPVDALGVVELQACRSCARAGAGFSADDDAAVRTQAADEAAAHMQRALRDTHRAGKVDAVHDVAHDLHFRGRQRALPARELGRCGAGKIGGPQVLQRQPAARGVDGRSQVAPFEQLLRGEVAARHGDHQVLRQAHVHAAHAHGGGRGAVGGLVQREAFDVADDDEPRRRLHRLGPSGADQSKP
ncbi:hypothetical protein SDC9_102646 [bioreactor metagenome]|uniref:Uncharacterized protein n=1 Tax=bioreactor metagenome TaxID=1076179 RepID=A0A645AS06_9ZZZZ